MVRFWCLVMLMTSTKLFAAELVFEGSSTVSPTVRDWKKLYEKELGLNVTVKGGGSSRGIACVKDNSCTIGMASKSVDAAKVAPAKVVHLGWDGLAFVTHKGVKIDNLNESQVKDIFSGKIKNWKDLGGPDLAINPLSRDESRAEQSQFKKVFGIDPIGSPMDSNLKTIRYVSRVASSISFMSLGLAQKDGKRLNILKYEGVEPNSKNLSSGAYKLRRELVMIYRDGDAQQKSIKSFLDSYLSKRSELFAEYGYVAD
ncbi:substrate-binding domain-containing protein [Pseudobacteriovorax antillogorgiicola]|uniref:Phosphate ABC transporter substrate-binding protein, PhoT family n=1 Tax=Pseudobacteriovorax antillogorgiicola TaxID=1513793 RepID=A0A1Y6BXN9_9BACT|nr:substrate-binding domain-containing protein [Pseudobacteriovorax antillogorgiicola]TCS53039.1 phosphate ABC transporter substrate-binding protein (PhoT family) [Pseudobacteriovorax antillogorgiicola]SMF26534.1 phosphate ABC transporter substrate-binding protein, PhoT family [Pseudobacteriovorax antillogorgiicola]